MNIKDIEINAGFAAAISLLEKGEQNLFITGKAGTGKSTLLQYFRQSTKRSIVILAPTGVAAVNIGGQTIHSFFGFKPDITVEKAKIIAKGKIKRKLHDIYKKLNTLVIDEVSMVRADLFDCMDAFLKIVRNKNSLPFGGVAVAMFGDLYQLPPVVTSHEKSTFNEHYKSPYFFDSHVYSSMNISLIELDKIYRQRDEHFVGLLNSIRNNSIDDEGISALNSRLINGGDFDEKGYIYLTSLNREAACINEEKLRRIPDRERVYHAEVDGDFDEKASPANRALVLKKGAQVMLLNNDSYGRWVNGTIATVINLERDFVSVLLPDGINEDIEPFKWQMFKFELEGNLKIISKPIGYFRQLPLSLAWAITIHKSQGKTFDKAIIDIGRTFECGQVYVALSRLRSIDGMFLKTPLKKGHVRVDPKIVNFLTSFRYDESEKNMPLNNKIEFISQVIDNDSLIEMIYLKNNDTKSKRIVKPVYIGEMEYSGKKFLGMNAVCRLRGEERVFRIDRILEMKMV